MGSEEEDKRKFIRAHLSFPVSIAYGENQTLELGEVEDLTVEGLAFYSQTPIEKGTGLYVIFPGGENVKENEVPGLVVRCQQMIDPAPGKYRIAVRFIEMNDAYLMDAFALIHSRRKKT